MAKNPDPTLKLTSSKGVTRTIDDWCTMFHLAPRDPARPPRGVGVRADRPADLRDLRRRRLPDRLRRDRQRVRGRAGSWAGPSSRSSRSATPTRSSSRASAWSGSPPSSTSARTRRSGPRPRAGTPTSGSAWPRSSAGPWRGPCPRSGATATPGRSADGRFRPDSGMIPGRLRPGPSPIPAARTPNPGSRRPDPARGALEPADLGKRRTAGPVRAGRLACAATPARPPIPGDVRADCYRAPTHPC